MRMFELISRIFGQRMASVENPETEGFVPYKESTLKDGTKVQLLGKFWTQKAIVIFKGNKDGKEHVPCMIEVGYADQNPQRRSRQAVAVSEGIIKPHQAAWLWYTMFNQRVYLAYVDWRHGAEMTDAGRFCEYSRDNNILYISRKYQTKPADWAPKAWPEEPKTTKKSNPRAKRTKSTA